MKWMNISFWIEKKKGYAEAVDKKMGSQNGPKRELLIARTVAWGKKNFARMRCKAKHICYITKYGWAHLPNIMKMMYVDWIFFSLNKRKKCMASKKQKNEVSSLFIRRLSLRRWIIGRMSASMLVHHPDDGWVGAKAVGSSEEGKR